MKEHSNYVKRSQRDYSMSLKLQIVSDIEKGFISITQAKKQYGIQARSTVVQWLIKFGNFDWENQTPIKMIKTP
ncbi:transposase, partial [Flavobacterium sp. JRM]